eukprot:Hpha_TRINITY_DN10035_c0_g1::TRINITY_DN10035_c0_g1_i1::g.84153::m.84153/K06639/CDC14; cell division cycle 14
MMRPQGHGVGSAASLRSRTVGARPRLGSTTDVGRAVALIPDRLFFLPNQSLAPRQQAGCVFLHTDELLRYEPFFLDYGPFNLGMVKRFVDVVDQAMATEGNPKVYICCGPEGTKRANGACVCACYLLLRGGCTAQAAIDKVAGVPVVPFHDATSGPDPFGLSIADVVKGLSKAVDLGWFKVDEFDMYGYMKHERLEHGDFNWIVPGKVLAFSGPNGAHTSFTAEMHAGLFCTIGVNCVVRLNERRYNRNVFVQAGFKHHDLLFPDGMNPPELILRKFLAVVEDNTQVVAIHCKAGLGRTGTLIASWMIKHFGFTAAEAIGWLRLCRPGSVIGQQQQFLEAIQTHLRNAGKNVPAGGNGLLPEPTGRPLYPPAPVRTPEPEQPPTQQQPPQHHQQQQRQQHHHQSPGGVVFASKIRAAQAAARSSSPVPAASDRGAARAGGPSRMGGVRGAPIPVSALRAATAATRSRSGLGGTF